MSKDSFDYTELTTLKVHTKDAVANKPTVQLLSSVILRPTLFSFPSPLSGRSPVLPGFRVPKYGYNAIDDSTAYIGDNFEQSSSPWTRQFTTELPRQCNVLEAVMKAVNFYLGVT